MAIADANYLRAAGWSVAVHNDYRLGGESFTFWLFTKGNRFVKGEGRSDIEALAQCASDAAALDAAAAVDGDAQWNAACEAVALALEARAAKVYDHAKGPYLESAADARSLKRLQ